MATWARLTPQTVKLIYHTQKVCILSRHCSILSVPGLSASWRLSQTKSLDMSNSFFPSTETLIAVSSSTMAVLRIMTVSASFRFQGAKNWRGKPVEKHQKSVYSLDTDQYYPCQGYPLRPQHRKGYMSPPTPTSWWGGGRECSLIISNTTMSEFYNTPVTAPRNMKAPKVHIKDSV